MIYPKRNPEMIQVAGGKVQSLMKGQERIFSRSDTRKIIKMARTAKTNKDLIELGKFICDATKKQDSRKPEFTDK